MEILKWRLFPVASVLISLFFFYLKNSSKFQASNSACSLLPHDEYWILSNQIVTPQGVFSGAVEVKGGKIASVVEGIDKNVVTGHVVDYGDAVVMPGLIDVARKQATTSCFMASWQDIFGITSQGTCLLSRPCLALPVSWYRAGITIQRGDQLELLYGIFCLLLSHAVYGMKRTSGSFKASAPGEEH